MCVTSHKGTAQSGCGASTGWSSSIPAACQTRRILPFPARHAECPGCAFARSKRLTRANPGPCPEARRRRRKRPGSTRSVHRAHRPRCNLQLRLAGTIGELKQSIVNALAFAPNRPLRLRRLPKAVQQAALRRGAKPTRLHDAVEDLEKRRIIAALGAHNENQTQAAKSLGLSRRTLFNRMIQFDLPRPRASS